ncbi:hypothetical protein MYX64_11595 [Nitrospinae bacterium AH_259_B05_G02_I21]|nr:hypothetical protein [Nitrospinae bacterium AH_259_B05_G02_I21]
MRYKTMPRAYGIHATLGVVRRRKRRRALLVGSLIVALAFCLSSLVTGWQWMSNIAAYRPGYDPKDFERTAFLAGQKLGAEKPNMTIPDVRKFNERQLEKGNYQNVKEILQTNSFAFEAGYNESSHPKKR